VREEMMRMHLERKRNQPGMVQCIGEDGQPSCSFCHGPFFYCSKSRVVTIDGRKGSDIVGCNRGKVKP